MGYKFLTGTDSGNFVCDKDFTEFFESDSVPCTHIHGVGNTAAYYLKNEKNITLDFCGAVVFLHGKIQPFFLENCENVTIKNVTVKYDRSPFTEGVIKERGDDYLVLKLNPEHKCKVENGNLIPYGETWENHSLNSYIMFFLANDGKTKRGIGGALGVIGSEPYLDEKLPYSKNALKLTAREDGDYVILEGDKIPDFYKPSDIFTISHEPRDVSSLAMLDCKNITIQNFRIINGIGMGIMPIHSRNIHIDGLKLYKDTLSSGITTNGADGIHAFACSGDFIVENSIFEGMVDDALNVHSNFYGFESAEGNIIKITAKGPENTSVKIFGEGDNIRIYKGSTLEKSEDYTVQKAEVTDDRMVLLTVDKPVKNHNKGDTVNNLSARCNLTIRNCRFANSAVSHIRIQNGKKALIENCETDFQIWLTGDMSYWYEADPVEEFTIRNCRFLRESANIRIIPEFFPTKAEPYYHKKINIEDCEFEAESPLYAAYAGEIAIKNIKNTNSKPMTVELLNCGECDAEDVTVNEKHETKTALNYN